MTKKLFAQPEMMVVNVMHNDIITDSTRIAFSNEAKDGGVACGADRFRDDWYIY